MTQMIYIPPIPEFSVPEVYDSGVPNRERIVFRPTELVNMACFSLLIGIQGDDGAVNPVNDWFFWFPPREITPPSHVLVFTGEGESKAGPIDDAGRVIHVYYWNHRKTLFGEPRVKPVLLKFHSIHIANKHPNLKPGQTIKQIA